MPNSFVVLPGSSSNTNQSSATTKTKKIRRVLGIDPGLASTGWGVIDYIDNRYRHIAHGTIETKSKTPHEIRLLEIYNTISSVIAKFSPTEAGMEALYFAKNVTSALPVAESRGVVLLCLAQNALSVCEYSPLSIKQAVVGSAKAEKSHVQHYVKLLLGLSEIPRPDHAADALAAAITKIHNTMTLK
ncbi:MAG: crossover junction endodeoxyribonuclease RuvC [Treponemataceae bacterium]